TSTAQNPRASASSNLVVFAIFCVLLSSFALASCETTDRSILQPGASAPVVSALIAMGPASGWYFAFAGGHLPQAAPFSLCRDSFSSRSLRCMVLVTKSGLAHPCHYFLDFHRIHLQRGNLGLVRWLEPNRSVSKLRLWHPLPPEVYSGRGTRTLSIGY